MPEGNFGIGGYFEVECFDKDGNLKWKDHSKNIYVQEGRDYVLNSIFKNTTPDDPLFIGLFAGAVPADGWTGGNANGNENSSYTEGFHQEFVDGAISGSTTRQLDNDASKATFNMDATVTLKGAYMTNESAKDSATGTLLCASQFNESDRSVVSADIVKVKYTVGCQSA